MTPVEIAAKALLGDFPRDPETIGGSWDRIDASDGAELVLRALHNAGWRLVRFDVNCGAPTSKHDYGDRHHAIGLCVTEMWTPEVSP